MLKAKRITVFFLLLLISGVLLSCIKQTRIPIESRQLTNPSGRQHSALVVFLPGHGDPLDRYKDKGIIQLFKDAAIPADMIAVDAHLGYYVEENLVSRLKQDVIDPAKVNGYEQIWIIGNSLGGLGALYYLKNHPEDIEGVLLLGPFVGEKEIIREIQGSGGVRNWNPGQANPQDWDRDLWAWIKDSVDDPASGMTIYLGFGTRDRYAGGQELLAEVLRPTRTFRLDGGHDWKTWRKLLEQFLDQTKLRKI